VRGGRGGWCGDLCVPVDDVKVFRLRQAFGYVAVQVDALAGKHIVCLQ